MYSRFFAPTFAADVYLKSRGPLNPRQICMDLKDLNMFIQKKNTLIRQFTLEIQ
jgi:hypothetical protein